MAAEIQTMADDDWESVKEIYTQGIATGAATFEREAPTWEKWNASHLPFGRLVARDDGRVVGWATLSPVSGRCCYSGVAEVSVYIREDCRNRGIGRLLLEALIPESERNGIWTLQGGTFAHNEGSLRLQKTCGFRVIGHRERIGQLNGKWVDTVLTERRSKIVGIEDDAI